MGGCSSDRYSFLRDNYGRQLKQLVVSIKNRHFVERTIAKVKQEVSEMAQQVREEQENVLQSKEKQSEEIWVRARGELDRQCKGGVEQLQRQRGNRAEELLGYSYVVDRYSQLRNSIQQAFAEQQKAVGLELQSIWQIEETENGSIAWSDFPQITPQEQKQVMRRGQLQCTHHLLNYQTYFLHQYQSQLNPQHYKGSFQLIRCEAAADSIHSMGKDKITANFNLFLGNSLDNYQLFK